MKALLLTFCLISCFVIGVSAQNEDGGFLFRQDVFVSGQEGYHTFRIPALVMTSIGNDLAFCEGRKAGSGDTGDIDLLVKRSVDGGRTWSKAMVVYEEGGVGPITIGNPCPIIDRNSSTIHLLFTRNNKRLIYTQSTDDGLTWSPPKECTEILNAFDYDWVRVATGPVHGIQMKNGRLVAPVWLSDKERKDRNIDKAKDRYRSGVIYSDDGGKTWKAGGLVPPDLNRLNECTVVETKKGMLMLNVRAQDEGYRAVSISADGGTTWSKPVLDKNLPCPSCQGSMNRLTDREILFLNPSVEKNSGQRPSRKNLTLRMSLDGGKSWPLSRIIHEGPAAYSDIAITNNNIILCLFENGENQYHEKISIVALTLDSLQ